VTISIKSEKLRDSGLGWVGQVPIHWAIVPTRAVLKLHRELVGDSWVDRQLLSLTKRGIVARDIDSGHGKYPSSFDTYQVVRSGHLVFCLFDVDETPRTVGLSDLNGMVTGAYDCFVTSSNLNERFAIWYYIAIDDGKRFRPLYSGLRKVIAKPRFLSAGFALPPLDEQRQIAEYLDRETGKIDELITKQEQLVATLTERREAFISQMLVGGDLEASERISTGHQWVQAVPIGWTLRTVRSISRVISKGTTPSTIGHDLANEGIRFLRGEDIQNGTIQNLTPRYISPETNLVLIRSQLRVGDVLFVIAGTLGKTAVVQLDNLPANLNQAISFVRLNDPRDADFLRLWFSSRQVREMTASAAVVSAQPNLSMESLGRIVVPVPPALERDRIVSLVSVEIRKIDASISMAAKLSQLLRERRAALVSAAVTGKIDVRGL